MKIRMRMLFLSFLLCLSQPLPALDNPAWAQQNRNYTCSLEEYEVPDVTLVNQDGVKVNLRQLLLQDRPVLVDFIYTTCTTICPVLSANFVNFQRRMEARAGSYRLVSISIDPEHDTPRAMKEYLKRYSARPGWDFLTGSKKDISQVVRTFNALGLFTPNKMEHYPLILIKSPAEKKWVRIYGLIGTTELMKEYTGVVK